MRLFEFARKAEKTIEEYGGNGIYLGGEDILAFIPIACVNSRTNQIQTIFDLIKQVDQDFKETLGNFAEEREIQVPTLSYGIMLAYIKYPLKEAMNTAHHFLLNKKAKNLPGKNGIALLFQKHSGAMIECLIDKNKSDSYELIQDLITHHTDKSKENNIFISGMMHKLNDDIFFELFEIAVDNNRIQAFMDNYFNEEIHKVKIEFIDAIKNFSIKVFADYPKKTDSQKPNHRKDILFTILRYIHFINSDKE